MANSSKIEWTDATWNPVVGCTIVSPGCTNCYAMRMAARLQRMGMPHYASLTQGSKAGAVWTGEVALAPDHILQVPLSWKKPKRIFVNSMGDLFHESIPDEWIDRVFAVMTCAGNHVFQVLTKRAARMHDYVRGLTRERIQQQAYTISRCVQFEGRWLFDLPLPNVWLGVSAERQQEWDERKEHLRATPAAVRFASFEPLLGTIIEPQPISDFIQWAIVGGESGPGARPMHRDWAISLRDQCTAAGVAFFFKQWGEWAPHIGAVDGWTLGDNPEISKFAHREWEDDHWSNDFWPMWCDFSDGNYDEMECVSRIGKKRAGRHLVGFEHNAMPVRP